MFKTPPPPLRGGMRKGRLISFLGTEPNLYDDVIQSPTRHAAKKKKGHKVVMRCRGDMDSMDIPLSAIPKLSPSFVTPCCITASL